ncbi:phospholipase A and acyltransferase 2 [Patella vulgata]|uniref:phospholipase A and acyltransferase 2 n=1 Tax=Patella vulgata TaxID=6465 RepID=UPI0021800741|nr:phospholipase A and acyltransferase 2 [Patella vulgata]
MQRTSDVMIHNTTVLSDLQEGDIVEFDRGLYSHYGVYVGNEEIVHLAGEDEYDGLGDVNTSHLFSISGQRFNKAWVKKDSFWTVTSNSRAKINNKDNKRKPLPKRQIVENALSRLGRVGYNLIYSNCEHFANWCRYEVEKSEQVDNWLTGLALGVAGVLTVVGAAFLMPQKDEKGKERAQEQ